MAYPSNERLVIFDADGTTIDAFHAVQQSFLRHGMTLGDLDRFRKRRRLFKYLGGLREFPNNLRRQFGKQNRARLRSTLTDFYRHEAILYPGIASLLRTLLDTPDVRVGIVTRNVTLEPRETLARLFQRHGIDAREFDFLSCLPLNDDKTAHFRSARERFAINPARAYACGDEFSDYRAAVGAAMHPFVVAYGAEDRERLQSVFKVPEECIAPTPEEFCGRLLHTLDITATVRAEEG